MFSKLIPPSLTSFLPKDFSPLSSVIQAQRALKVKLMPTLLLLRAEARQKR